MKKSQRQKDADTNTMLRVPNTPDGRWFLKQLRKYAIGGTRIWARGRGPRAKHAKAQGRWARAFDQQIPHEFAEHFAVYIWKTKLVTISKAHYDEVKLHLAQLQIAEHNQQWETLREKLKQEEAEKTIITLLDLWKPRKIKV